MNTVNVFCLLKSRRISCNHPSERQLLKVRLLRKHYPFMIYLRHNGSGAIRKERRGHRRRPKHCFMYEYPLGSRRSNVNAGLSPPCLQILVPPLSSGLWNRAIKSPQKVGRGRPRTTGCRPRGGPRDPHWGEQDGPPLPACLDPEYG